MDRIKDHILSTHKGFYCFASADLWDMWSSIVKGLKKMDALQSKSAPINFPEESIFIFILNKLDIQNYAPFLDELSAGGATQIGFLLEDNEAWLSFPESLWKKSNVLLSHNPGHASRELICGNVRKLYKQLLREKENLMLQQQIVMRRKSLGNILHISRALATERKLDVLITSILDYVREAASADGGSIYVVESHKNGTQADFLRFKGSAMLLKQDEFLLPINNQSIAGYVALTGKPVIIKDAYKLPANISFRFHQKFDRIHSYHTKSVMALPMINQLGEIMGVLQLVNRKRNFEKKLTIEDMKGKEVIPFSQRDYQLASVITSQSAIALYNHKLIHGQRELLESVIHLIDGAIDAKSSHTGGHCHRVPILTEMLAQAVCDTKEGTFADFHLSEEQWYELRIAAGLHDCGKIVTPVHVMEKATKLETIFDRIELIKLRFSILKQEAKQEHRERCLAQKIQEPESEAILEKRLQKIHEMQSFIENANIGGEFLS